MFIGVWVMLQSYMFGLTIGSQVCLIENLMHPSQNIKLAWGLFPEGIVSWNVSFLTFPPFNAILSNTFYQHNLEKGCSV